MNATGVTAGPAESNGKLLLGTWRDSLHVTCGLTACTPESAPGPTLGNEYGKTLPFTDIKRHAVLGLPDGLHEPDVHEAQRAERRDAQHQQVQAVDVELSTSLPLLLGVDVEVCVCRSM